MPACIPSIQANDQPRLGVAANFNVTMRLEASMRGGVALPELRPALYDRSGAPYAYQQYAEVTSVSPATGSTVGGTLMTITGRGFPSLGSGAGDTVTVRVGGAPCTVVTSTYSTLTCRTSPQPAAAPLTATALRNQYAGMRGAEYEFYNTILPSASLWRLNDTVTTASVLGSYKEILMDYTEAREYSAVNSCSRMKFFFTAPTAGAYRFFMSIDDYAQLNGTWVQVNAGGDYVCARMHVCVRACVRVRACVCVCVRACVCARVHTGWVGCSSCFRAALCATAPTLQVRVCEHRSCSSNLCASLRS